MHVHENRDLDAAVSSSAYTHMLTLDDGLRLLIGQLHTGSDDSLAHPLLQDLPLRREVPYDGERQPVNTCRQLLLSCVSASGPCTASCRRAACNKPVPSFAHMPCSFSPGASERVRSAGA